MTFKHLLMPSSVTATDHLQEFSLSSQRSSKRCSIAWASGMLETVMSSLGACFLNSAARLTLKIIQLPLKATLGDTTS
jgi:hypothetical protein